MSKKLIKELENRYDIIFSQNIKMKEKHLKRLKRMEKSVNEFLNKVDHAFKSAKNSKLKFNFCEETK